MKCNFLWCTIRVKGYRLCCTEKGKTPKFITSRHVSLDENAIISQREDLNNLVGNKHLVS